MMGSSSSDMSGALAILAVVADPVRAKAALDEIAAAQKVLEQTRSEVLKLQSEVRTAQEALSQGVADLAASQTQAQESLRVERIRLKDGAAELQRRLSSVASQEALVASAQLAADQATAAVAPRTDALDKREAALDDREAALNSRESTLAALEADYQARLNRLRTLAAA